MIIITQLEIIYDVVRLLLTESTIVQRHGSLALLAGRRSVVSLGSRRKNAPRPRQRTKHETSTSLKQQRSVGGCANKSNLTGAVIK
eukprot:scaffold4081_cov145-Skeletonema_menzelii.AAC.3